MAGLGILGEKKEKFKFFVRGTNVLTGEEEKFASEFKEDLEVDVIPTLKDAKIVDLSKVKDIKKLTRG